MRTRNPGKTANFEANFGKVKNVSGPNQFDFLKVHSLLVNLPYYGPELTQWMRSNLILKIF